MKCLLATFIILLPPSMSFACASGPALMETAEIQRLKLRVSEGVPLSTQEKSQLADFGKDYNLAHSGRGKLRNPICRNLTEKEMQERKTVMDSCDVQDCSELNAEELAAAPYIEESGRWRHSPQERAKAKQIVEMLTAKWSEN